MKDESISRAVDDVLSYFKIRCEEKDGKFIATYMLFDDEVSFFKPNEDAYTMLDCLDEMQFKDKKDFAKKFHKVWCFKSGALVMRNVFYGKCIEEVAMSLELKGIER